MSLAVPPVTQTLTMGAPSAYNYNSNQTTESPPATNNTESLLEVKYDVNRHELIFEENVVAPIRNGDWVVITVTGKLNLSPSDGLKLTLLGRPPTHFRIEDISLYPTVKLSGDPVNPNTTINQVDPTRTAVPATPATTPPPPAILPAKMVVYKENFDDMTEIHKAESIVSLLQTLPRIKDMKAHLVQQSRFSEPSLRTWKERVSPAALGLLRWIIASNRSCIVQVDKCPGQDEAELVMSKVRLDQRVSNISESWVQFRFAQGSPDKEQRFLDALREQQANLNPKYPTIFAWHGSPLPNWHSIVRTGLDFKETLHGRAYGHGVYHAQDQQTSVGYAQHNQVS